METTSQNLIGPKVKLSEVITEAESEITELETELIDLKVSINKAPDTLLAQIHKAVKQIEAKLIGLGGRLKKAKEMKKQIDMDKSETFTIFSDKIAEINLLRPIKRNSRLHDRGWKDVPAETKNQRAKAILSPYMEIFKKSIHDVTDIELDSFYLRIERSDDLIQYYLVFSVDERIIDKHLLHHFVTKDLRKWFLHDAFELDHSGNVYKNPFVLGKYVKEEIDTKGKYILTTEKRYRSLHENYLKSLEMFPYVEKQKILTIQKDEFTITEVPIAQVSLWEPYITIPMAVENLKKKKNLSFDNTTLFIGVYSNVVIPRKRLSTVLRGTLSIYPIINMEPAEKTIEQSKKEGDVEPGQLLIANLMRHEHRDKYLICPSSVKDTFNDTFFGNYFVATEDMWINALQSRNIIRFFEQKGWVPQRK